MVCETTARLLFSATVRCHFIAYFGGEMLFSYDYYLFLTRSAPRRLCPRCRARRCGTQRQASDAGRRRNTAVPPRQNAGVNFSTPSSVQTMNPARLGNYEAKILTRRRRVCPSWQWFLQKIEYNQRGRATSGACPQ